MPTITCHSCRRSLEFTPPLPRSASCEGCQCDLRCCANCRFFDRQAHRSCREEQAGWVKVKERANFCSYFSPGAAVGPGIEAQAMAKLDELFSQPAKLAAAAPAVGLAAQLAAFLDAKR